MDSKKGYPLLFEKEGKSTTNYAKSRFRLTLASLSGSITVGAFLLYLIVPRLLLGHSLFNSAFNVYVSWSLFILAMACLFIVSPITILQETRRRKLEDAIHHYIKNKMQEIVLAVDLVQSSLVAVDTSVAYKDKVQMLEDVRAICTDVSHNLTQKILDEAPTFNRHRASEPRARPKDVEESVVETVPVVVNIDDKKTTRQ